MGRAALDGKAEELLGELQLRQVLETLPVGVLVLDRKGDVLLSNSFAGTVWGGLIESGRERWQKSFGTYRDTGKPVEEWASVRALRLGETTLNELIDIETHDGKKRVIQNSAAPIRDHNDSIVGAVVVNEDVTDRVLAEEALRSSRQQLLDSQPELERRLRQQEAVAQLSQSALKQEKLQPLFEEAVALTAASCDLEFADVSEFLPDDTLVLHAVRGWQPEVADRMHLPISGGSLCAYVLKTNAPGIVEDARQEQRFEIDPRILKQGMLSYVTVLIGGGGAKPFGALGAGSSKPRRYSQHDVNFVQAMANVLASAVERLKVSRQLREQRMQMQALSRKLIAAQEAERRVVARELHDDFGQVLTALKLNLERHDRDPAESIELVDGAIARMRDLAQDLRPPLLDELGLESSVRWYVEREARRAGLEAKLHVESLEPRPSPEMETTCFRVAQEALNNVIRHAQATRVEISLRVVMGKLLLEIRDDGRGFDVAEAQQRAMNGASQGLLSMQERVALAGGELQIDSAPGRGTVVRARLDAGR